MDKELQNLLDNYEQAIYGYTEPIIPSIHQIHLLLDYISRLNIQVKKQKEVINKVTNDLQQIIDNVKDRTIISLGQFISKLEIIQDELNGSNDILKEVSE